MCDSHFDVTGWVCMRFVSIWSTPSLKLSRIEKPKIESQKSSVPVFCECPGKISLPFTITNIISLIFHLQTLLRLSEAAQHRNGTAQTQPLGRLSVVSATFRTAMVFQAQGNQRSSTQTASSFAVSNEETMETTEWPLLPMTVRPTSSSSSQLGILMKMFAFC